MILSKRSIEAFTLIEVLVALSLVSIAILATVGVFSTLGLSREHSQQLLRVATDVDNFLSVVQTERSWTNWGEGEFFTNLGGTPLVVDVVWQGEVCGVVVRGVYVKGKRTNSYDVQTHFSYAYERAW